MTARAQLNLAQTNEKRQHGLYEAKGAALKDWQQARSIWPPRKADLRSAEIALAAVRNRLRILGRSEAEIDAIERARPAGIRTPRCRRCADRRHGDPAPGRPRPVHRQRGDGASTPVFTIGDMSKVWLVANVREEDAPADARRASRSKCGCWPFPAACSRRSSTYIAPGDRSRHAPPAGARRGREPGRGAEAGDVRELQHRHRRPVRARPFRSEAIVYEGDTARVWVAMQPTRRSACARSAPGASMTAWSRCSPG